MCANGPHEPDAWLKRPHKPALRAGQDQLRHSAIAARPPASDASAPQVKQGWGEGGRGPPGPCPAPVVLTAPAPGRGLRLPEVRDLRTTVTCAWRTQDVAAPGVGPGRPSSSLCLPHAPRRPSSLTRTHELVSSERRVCEAWCRKLTGVPERVTRQLDPRGQGPAGRRGGRPWQKRGHPGLRGATHARTRTWL